jgi:hypothetical protein
VRWREGERRRQIERSKGRGDKRVRKAGGGKEERSKEGREGE